MERRRPLGKPRDTERAKEKEAILGTYRKREDIRIRRLCVGRWKKNRKLKDWAQPTIRVRHSERLHALPFLGGDYVSLHNKYIEGNKDTNRRRLFSGSRRRGIAISLAYAKTPLLMRSFRKMSTFFVEHHERSILAFIAELVSDYRINRLQKWQAARPQTEAEKAVALINSGH